MLLQEDGRFLLFQDGRVSILGLDGVQRVVASALCPGNDRFNDVIADPEGRVFAGAMGGNGRLLRFDRDGSVHQVLDGIGIPNGMGFTLDLKGMYFTDSVMRQIYLLDYDRRTGGLSNRRVFAEIPKDQGVPDGMAIDAEGFVWTAIWFGGRLKRYAPDGTWDSDVHLSVLQPSAVAFGGPDLSDVYVTSAAAHEPSPLEPPGFDTNAQRGGSLYALRVRAIRGRPLFRARIDFGRKS
jgi:D-xylonolactonase